MTDVENPSRSPVRRRIRWDLVAVAAFTLAFVCVGIVWASITAPFRSPDEGLHFSSIIRVAEGGGWPDPGEARVPNALVEAIYEANDPAADRSTLDELKQAHPGDAADRVDQMTQHPPLYYVIAGAVYDALDMSHWRWDHAMLGLRIFDVLLISPLPLLLFSSARLAMGGLLGPLTAAATPLAIPQLSSIGGSINNDSFFIVTSALLAWGSLHVFLKDQRWLSVLGLGALAGLAAWSKGTVLAAMPLVFFASLFSIAAPRSRLVVRLWKAIAAMAAAAALGLFWWALNVVRFGSVQPDGLGRPAIEWPAGGGPDVGAYLDELWRAYTASFWGEFGWLEFPLSMLLVQFLTSVCIFVIVAFGFINRRDRMINLLLATQVVAVAVILLYGSWVGYTKTGVMAGMQGRYLFGTIVPLVIMSALAWRAMVRPRAHYPVALAIAIGCLVMAANGMLAGYVSFWQGWPELTAPGVAHWLRFGIASKWIIGGGILISVIAGATAILAFIRAAGDRSRRLRAVATTPAPVD